jgi:hypothetical protein
MTNGTGSTATRCRNFARKKAPDEQITPKRANIFVRGRLGVPKKREVGELELERLRTQIAGFNAQRVDA